MGQRVAHIKIRGLFETEDVEPGLAMVEKKPKAHLLICPIVKTTGRSG